MEKQQQPNSFPSMQSTQVCTYLSRLYQRFVSSIENMEVIPSHLQLIDPFDPPKVHFKGKMDLFPTCMLFNSNFVLFKTTLRSRIL